jgi:hypothetical protein
MDFKIHSKAGHCSEALTIYFNVLYIIT